MRDIRNLSLDEITPEEMEQLKKYMFENSGPMEPCINGFNFELLKQGVPLKRKPWGGYWKWENETIMMYCKDGVVIDIREAKDMGLTISNMFAQDWEIATAENCDIGVI